MSSWYPEEPHAQYLTNLVPQYGLWIQEPQILGLYILWTTNAGKVIGVTGNPSRDTVPDHLLPLALPGDSYVAPFWVVF